METALERRSEATNPASWVELHGDYLFRYAIRRAGSAGAAEDLVQETFLGALKGREQFAGACSERTWLVSILKRKIIDYLRRRNRERPASDVVPAEWIDELFDARGHWKKAPPRWSNPAAALENVEFWQTFSRCLHKLPRRLAEAFALRELDELPGTEVCDIMAIAPANLWVMLHRARLQLWRCLESNWFGDREGEPVPGEAAGGEP